jgi:hypothetical protein
MHAFSQRRMMMKTKTALLFATSAILLVAVVGCGTAATPTPSATQTPFQITVVITATQPPPTATSAAPTITPLPTIAANVTPPTVAPTAKPSNTPGPAKPTATKKPAVAVATATQTPLPLTSPAPVLIRPNFDPNTGQKDERHSPSDALIFEWQSIGPLGPNVCYMARIDFVPTNEQPGGGDAFLQCDPQWTQKAQSQTVQFVLNQPGHTGLNYSGLLPNPPTDLWVKWYITVVADQGAGTGPQDPNGTRHKVSPLSAKSQTFQFLLKGGGQ